MVGWGSIPRIALGTSPLLPRSPQHAARPSQPCPANRAAHPPTHPCGRESCWQTEQTPCAACWGTGEAGARLRLAHHTPEGHSAASAPVAPRDSKSCRARRRLTCVLLRVVNTISASDRNEASIDCSACGEDGGGRGSRWRVVFPHERMPTVPPGGSLPQRAAASVQTARTAHRPDRPWRPHLAHTPVLLLPPHHAPGQAHPLQLVGQPVNAEWCRGQRGERRTG